MFTQNEERILEWLRRNEECGLVELAANCSMARSSAHTAIQSLLERGILLNVRPNGRAKYRIADRDAIERAAQHMLEKFRAAVAVETSNRARPHLVFTDCYVLPSEYLETLGGYYDITVSSDEGYLHNAEAFNERTLDAEVIVRYDFSPIDRDFIQARPKLKGVVFPTCFPVNVDLQACKDFGVIVKHADPVTQKYFSSTHVEFAVHATMTLLNPLRQTKNLADYHWHTNLGGELFGKNIGLVAGNTNIRSLVEIFQAFGCTVRAASTAATPPMPSEFGLVAYRDANELWDWCDILIALDGAQPNLNALLERGERPRYLINLSTTVEFDTELALRALEAGHLAGLAIDVVPFTWSETMSRQEMNTVHAKLQGFPNVLITPEMGVLTEESIQRSYTQTFEMLMALRLDI
jgi:phosphoglycerate dehydrogenase-like enzyme/predicted transcriptional regulator